MIHVPSTRYRQELARSVEVVRLGMAAGVGPGSSVPLEPVLLVKATTLKLKYLIRLRTFRLLFWGLHPSRHLWYGIQIADDPEKPGTLWSLAESEEEFTALEEN
jgi:hypothetical protein